MSEPASSIHQAFFDTLWRYDDDVWTHTAVYVDRTRAQERQPVHARLRDDLLRGKGDVKRLFTGQIGAGKSTELRQLVADPELQKRCVVVVVDANDREEEGPDVLAACTLVHPAAFVGDEAATPMDLGSLRSAVEARSASELRPPSPPPDLPPAPPRWRRTCPPADPTVVGPNRSDTGQSLRRRIGRSPAGRSTWRSGLEPGDRRASVHTSVSPLQRKRAGRAAPGRRRPWPAGACVSTGDAGQPGSERTPGGGIRPRNAHQRPAPSPVLRTNHRYRRWWRARPPTTGPKCAFETRMLARGVRFDRRCRDGEMEALHARRPTAPSDVIVEELELASRPRPPRGDITLQTHRLQRCEPTVVIPLWDTADLREHAPVVDERYYTTREFRVTEACQAVERVRTAE